MSRFAPGIRRGSKVSQGDIIGYVGSTGWSTGAHLHYEFRVDNEARDPSKVAMMPAGAADAGEMARFRMAAADMIAPLRAAAPCRCRHRDGRTLSQQTLHGASEDAFRRCTRGRRLLRPSPHNRA